MPGAGPPPRDGPSGQPPGPGPGADPAPPAGRPAPASDHDSNSRDADTATPSRSDPAAGPGHPGQPGDAPPLTDADAPPRDDPGYGTNPYQGLPGWDPGDDGHPGGGLVAPAWPPLPATLAGIPPVLGRPPPGSPHWASRPPDPPRRPPDPANGPSPSPAPGTGQSGTGGASGTGPPGTGPPGTGLPASGLEGGVDAGSGTRRPPSGLLDLTIGWATLAGHSAVPADLGRTGPVTAPQARLLAATAIPDPHAQWRVILTDPGGHAIAVERIRRGPRICPRQDHRPPGTAGRVTITLPASVLDQPWPVTSTPAGGILTAALRAGQRAARRAAKTAAAGTAAPGGCAHTTATPAYRPPPRTRELVEARDQTCRHPRCGQPAWRSDLDHTTPWHRGGPTCHCNLGAFCRTHHQIKQQPGWTLTQPHPGHFELTTPAGRTYTTHPHTHTT
jgi:hypothetical protein